MNREVLSKYKFAIVGLALGMLTVNCYIIDFKIALKFREIDTRLTVIETNINVPNYRDIPLFKGSKIKI